jgi:hypothetical protein
MSLFSNVHLADPGAVRSPLFTPYKAISDGGEGKLTSPSASLAAASTGHNGTFPLNCQDMRFAEPTHLCRVHMGIKHFRQTHGPNILDGTS